MRQFFVLSFLFIGGVVCAEEMTKKEGQKLFAVDLAIAASKASSSDKYQPKIIESNKTAHQSHEKSSKEDARMEKGEHHEEDWKRKLLESKSENLLFSKMIDFFLSNPNTKFERECFAKLKPGHSVDFIVDLAASPSQDKVDKMLAESPIALYLQQSHRSASLAYRSAVELFIDAVAYDMKPEQTLSVIYENGRKYFIRGESIEHAAAAKGEFVDSMRNLRTLWPTSTRSKPDSPFGKIVKNNLGREVRLVLENRDNGIATVLANSRSLKPVYSIVITDGASGVKIRDLVDDLATTTVIDIGNHRFLKGMQWKELQQLANFYTLSSPQQLALMADTARMVACSFIATN